MAEDQTTTAPVQEASKPDGKSESADSSDLSFVYEAPVTLQVQLGEAILTIGDILKCGKGSVIPLNQKVGEPFKVLLQKRPIAEGEIVEAGERLAIKITNVLKAGADEKVEQK